MLITRVINYKNLNHRKISDNFFDIEIHQKSTQEKVTKVLYKWATLSNFLGANGHA